MENLNFNSRQSSPPRRSNRRVGTRFDALIGTAACIAGFCGAAGAAGPEDAPTAERRGDADSERRSLPEAVSPEQWARVEASVDRALAWLSAQQKPDGSFPTAPEGEPAVTSLCLLAFLSRGHQPGTGPYGGQLDRALDFVLKCQRPDGLLSLVAVETNHVHLGASHTAAYTHAISALMLTEVFGSVSGERSRRIKEVVDKAIRFTRRLQHEPPKAQPVDKGGWRYVRKYMGAWSPSDSDLSVTGWHLMFLRSAKNAGFEVPEEMIAAGLEYVERCFDPRTGLFYYGLVGNDRYSSRAMMGAGALSLSMGGRHHTEMARKAGDWLLDHPFAVYGATVGGRGDRFHYGAYYCSQAMVQLGGRYWEGFFPPLVTTFLRHQSAEGAWAPETGSERGEDVVFGQTYTTALGVLALTPPYQLLPIYQR